MTITAEFTLPDGRTATAAVPLEIWLQLINTGEAKYTYTEAEGMEPFTGTIKWVE